MSLRSAVGRRGLQAVATDRLTFDFPGVRSMSGIWVRAVATVGHQVAASCGTSNGTDEQPVEDHEQRQRHEREFRRRTV